MTENMKQFLNLVATDKELKAEMNGATDYNCVCVVGGYGG